MTSFLVIDASAVYRLLLTDTGEPHLEATVRILKREGQTLCAPTLWLYEITSTLTKMAHFGVLDAQEAIGLLALAHDLNIQTIHPDQQQRQRAFEWTVRLKRAAAYDSFYLATAETLGCELWTADRRLVNAANQPWVKYALSADGEAGNAASV